MARPKKAAPEILTPEELEERMDAMSDDWKEIYLMSLHERVAGDYARADELLMIAGGLRQLGIEFQQEQKRLQLARSRAQRAPVRRRKPVVSKAAAIS